MKNNFIANILIILSILSITSCKKDKDKVVSKVVEVSYPTINYTGEEVYSIKLGDPSPNISATAYDSLLHESCEVAFDANAVDNTTPGLYIAPIVAKNSNGYTSELNVLVAVTDIDPSIDLSGDYTMEWDGASVNITKVANGLYLCDDVAGANAVLPPLIFKGYFCQTSITSIDFPDQNVFGFPYGPLSIYDATVNMTDDTTTIQWTIDGPYFDAYFGVNPYVMTKEN